MHGNKEIEVRQCTIIVHLDDLKILHSKKQVLEDFVHTTWQ